MPRAFLALLLLLAACGNEAAQKNPAAKLSAAQVCSAAAARHDACGFPLSDSDRSACPGQVDGGKRAYWECVAQLPCANEPGSCTIRP